MIKGVLAAVAATLGIFVLAQTASAQYPPPEGNLYCSVDKIVIEANGTAMLTVTLTDTNSDPVPGHGVTFTVTSGNATVSPNYAVTDGMGKASTKITADPNFVGKIEVLAYTNSRSCRISLDPARVPFVQVLSAPPTGNGGLIGAKGQNPTLLLAAALDFVMLGVLGMLLVTSSGPVWQGTRHD